MSDKWRIGLEFTGLFMVASSLIFVALQMQQDRKIALAQLNSSHLEMFTSRFTAGMENDAYLTMWSKLYATSSWDREGFTDKEVAAAEIDSAIWWTYVELNFENYRRGLVTEEAWQEMEIEIKGLGVTPVNRAVF